jgi:hypothetical protein
MEGYRDYLESKYHAAFDQALPIQREMTRKAEELLLLTDFNDKWREEVEDGLAGAWDGTVRNRVIDADGVAAEVLFPDGITEMNAPPFGAGLALKPWGIDPELQWAGARAHNRWMAEFMKDDPVRRIGLAIVLMLYDVDEALNEVKWAHRNGFKGILIPPLMGDKDAYNHPKYYPIWEYCQEHNLVIHTHSGPSPDYDFTLPGAIGVFVTEFAWWAARPLWFMIFGGVFEQFFASARIPVSGIILSFAPQNARTGQFNSGKRSTKYGICMVIMTWPFMICIIWWRSAISSSVAYLGS